ncbi:hypothetical protein CDAR_69201 [Caerostris darwini]|uniref:Uncharacterized protein n=1 Tax=Caerostris darwini TaxID=1538125 RepID=A0AAV4U0L7_9ARAC|nr:hypothetical protein CDAR_69201 [Caerostris darwini]
MCYGSPQLNFHLSHQPKEMESVLNSRCFSFLFVTSPTGGFFSEALSGFSSMEISENKKNLHGVISVCTRVINMRDTVLQPILCELLFFNILAFSPSNNY